jgi:hypothetical protein
MHHPRLFKPESIANVQNEIQIVDIHETFETRIAIGLQAFGYQLNRTLLFAHSYLPLHFSFASSTEHFPIPFTVCHPACTASSFLIVD